MVMEHSCCFDFGSGNVGAGEGLLLMVHTATLFAVACAICIDGDLPVKGLLVMWLSSVATDDVPTLQKGYV